jgi:hypothetical protein
MAIGVSIALWFLGGFEMWIALKIIPKPQKRKDCPEWALTAGEVFWTILWPIAVILLAIKWTHMAFVEDAKKTK